MGTYHKEIDLTGRISLMIEFACQFLYFPAMLRTVYASRFIKPMESGKTSPFLIECEGEDGSLHEVVVKYSSAMMEKEKYLAAEAISALLAADLDLPVAEPFVVELDPMFVQAIDDPKHREALKSSCPQAFGCAIKTGVSPWMKHQTVEDDMAQTAAEIAVFDQIIINGDRRPDVPNCLVKGSDLLIIDHELAFFRGLFWTSPWQDGGLEALQSRDLHIFAKQYFSSPVTTFERFVAAWDAIPNSRFDEYMATLPQNWVYDEGKLNEILVYLKECKQNIRTIVDYALKVYA